MDQEIITGSNVFKLLKNCCNNNGDDILIPLNNVSHDRDIIEDEWNQEYYIIYNSYILEDKDF